MDGAKTDIQTRVKQKMRTLKRFEVGFRFQKCYRHADVEELIAHLLAESDARVSTLLAEKVSLSLRCGQILGEAFDGVAFDEVCMRLVAAEARVSTLQKERDTAMKIPSKWSEALDEFRGHAEVAEAEVSRLREEKK